MADETVNSDTQNAESINDILEETPEETTVDNSQLEEKNKQLFERAKKAEAEAKELRAKVGEAKPSESNLTMEAIMVGKKLDKYSEDEIQSIAKIIKSDKPSDILAALDNPFIKQGIDTAREKVTKENKVPSSSGSSGGGSQLSGDEVAKMDREDHKKLWKEQQERQQGGQGI